MGVATSSPAPWQPPTATPQLTWEEIIKMTEENIRKGKRTGTGPLPVPAPAPPVQQMKYVLRKQINNVKVLEPTISRAILAPNKTLNFTYLDILTTENRNNTIYTKSIHVIVPSSMSLSNINLSNAYHVMIANIQYPRIALTPNSNIVFAKHTDGIKQFYLPNSLN